jgi:hypothetical protein
LIKEELKQWPNAAGIKTLRDSPSMSGTVNVLVDQRITIVNARAITIVRPIVKFLSDFVEKEITSSAMPGKWLTNGQLKIYG